MNRNNSKHNHNHSHKTIGTKHYRVLLTNTNSQDLEVLITLNKILSFQELTALLTHKIINLALIFLNNNKLSILVLDSNNNISNQMDIRICLQTIILATFRDHK